MSPALGILGRVTTGLAKPSDRLAASRPSDAVDRPDRDSEPDT